MKRKVCTILAVMILALGFVALVTPIPGATIFLALGLTLLISVSPPARFCIQWLRVRFSFFNTIISFIDRKVGSRFETLGKTLKLTDPGDLKADQSHDEFVKSQIAKSSKDTN